MSKTAPVITSYLDGPRMDWVDTVASTFQEKANELLGAGSTGPQIKSLLNGTPIRHRLHPALVDVPIGAWMTSFYLDGISMVVNGEQRKRFESGAEAAIALGIIGSLPAALTGTADWVDVGGKPKRYGMVHALLNTAALASYSVSLVARRKGNPNRGLALASAGVGFLAMTVSATIGGALVYEHGVNVPLQDPPADPPEDFTHVLDSHELAPGDHREVEAGGFPILLVRDDDGTLHALQHWCPHAGGPLSGGKLEDGVIVCPWHGSSFCVDDGQPLQGPASTPLTVYDVREEDGRIMVGPAA